MIRLRWTTSHPIPDETTRKSLNQMRKGGILTDMALTNGLRVYQCHKIILSGASPFIREIIKAATASSKSDSIVVSINDEYLPQMDHLMQFLYLGVLIIDPPSLNDLCQLANKLLIKFLMDGVERPPSRLGESPVPAGVKAITIPSKVGKLGAGAVDKHRMKDSGAELEKHRKFPHNIKRNPAKQNNFPKIQGKPKISPQSPLGKKRKKTVKHAMNTLKKTEVPPPQPQPHCSTVQPALVPTLGNNNNYMTPKTSSSNDAPMANRLKRKALNFLASAHNKSSSSCFKHIPRRKQRTVKNHETENQNPISCLPKKQSPTNKQGPGQGITADAESSVQNLINPIDTGRLRRKAYLKAGENVKIFIARISKRKY